MPSYATQRKLKIIEEKLGADWADQHQGMSIDRVYNMVIGDSRKNLFCKVSAEVKSRLDEMVREYDIDMADLIERLIDGEHERFEARRSLAVTKLADQFTDI